MKHARIIVSLSALLVAGRASAAVSVAVTQPAANAVVGNSLPVTATISTPYQITSVKAQVGSVTSALPAATTSSGTLDLTSVPTGPVTLTVTAMDGQGGVGSAQVSLQHDLPPSLVLTAPLPGTVARPSTHVTLACVDPDAYGCTSVELHVGSPTGTLIASGNPIDQDLSFGAYLGQQINLYAVAKDSAGLQATSAAIPLYVDTSPRLVEVESVGGPIDDVDSTRIVFGSTIHTRGTTTDLQLPASLGSTCRLSPNGALCNGGEWKNGAVAATWTLAAPAGAGDIGTSYFTARGNYAIWTSTDAMGNHDAYFRDSVAGTTTLVKNNGINFAYAGDVAANGDALFVFPNASQNDYPVYRYSAGSLVALTDTTGNAKYESPKTDGTNVAYQRWFLGYQGGVYLQTPSSLVTLVPDNACQPSGLSFAIDNGWTAYAAPDSACGSVQIWTRAPDDTRTQLSIWSTSSTVDAINGVGQVMLFNASSLGTYRYLVSPGSSPDAISSTLGRALFLDGAWYVVMGRTLFSIAGLSPIDGGAGGMPDMTVADDLSAPPMTDLSVVLQDLAVEPTDLAMAPFDASLPTFDASAPSDLALSSSDASTVLDLATRSDAALTGGGTHGGCQMAPRATPFDGSLAAAMTLALAVVGRRRARSSHDRVR